MQLLTDVNPRQADSGAHRAVTLTPLCPLLGGATEHCYPAWRRGGPTHTSSGKKGRALCLTNLAPTLVHGGCFSP